MDSCIAMTLGEISFYEPSGTCKLQDQANEEQDMEGFFLCVSLLTNLELRKSTEGHTLISSWAFVV